METTQIGSCRDEVNHTRRGVTTEQRTLRPAQHFDALEIEILGFEKARCQQRCAVDVNCGRAVARCANAQIADPANGEARSGEVTLGEGDVGQRQLQIAGVLYLLLFKRLATKSADRDRHILKPLRSTLRGNDDGVFVDRCSAFGCLSKSRECYCASTNACEQN